ncbi:MAG: hypothetical protein KBE23_06685 [Chloroflexi bacterium]|nr:hypothetical protein [Chloroflexota bacterium]MBP7042412.1 hypothetical protein [Chloroflexota bacterium]
MGTVTMPTATLPIAPSETAVVEIDLVRHEHFYFYNRRENGRSVVNAQRISPQRAQDIYEANADAQQHVTGRVDFGPASCEWTWTAKLAL